MNAKENVINDLVYFKDIKIVQNKNYFNFSLDSILLPNFVNITNNNSKILDLCTGNAPIPIILSTKTKSKIIGIELQDEIYDLAKKSIEINKLENRIDIIKEDVKKIDKLFETDTFDIITCNPPYFKKNEGSILNDNEIKSIARHEITITIEEIIKISKKLLKNGGSLCIIQRTDRFSEILDIMKRNNIEPKRIRFIYPKIDKESNLFMIDGKKNGSVGLKILPPLYIHNSDGSYTNEVLKMFGK